MTSEALDAIRRRVINVIGHELRTPVSTIRGLAESIEGLDDEVVRSEVAPALLRNARRLELLVDEMLAASGITTVLPVDPPSPQDVAAAAQRAWEKVSDGAPAAAIEGSGTASVSPVALDGILERVLDNAAKYGKEPAVVRVTEEGGRVTVEVDSPGAELHPEEVEHAAEAFYRGEQAVMTAPGMGLGLAVAMAMAEHAGGTLTVTARPGGGLVTSLELPASVA